MADITTPGLPPQDNRQRAVKQLMRDVRAALAAGRSVNEHSLMAAHPELMPELQQAFQALLAHPYNTPFDDTNAAETVVRPGRSTVPGGVTDETIARPGRGNTPGMSGGDTSAAAWAEGDSTAGGRGAGGFGMPARDAANPQMISIPGYSVQRELSRGGQAVVFIAIHLATGRKVALKVMREGPFADERSMARFQREVQILAALDHPNIVSIIDTGKTADGSHFIAMPYIAGVTLDECMQRRQKESADPSKLLRMFYKICTAVNEAHLRGIVHRDLKPANIRVDERGEPHVLDFGLARSALDRFIKGTNEPVSITGEFMGSLPWSSPEQAEGDPEKIDMRTDVYSLGVILYQMLTGGRFPYEVVGNIRDVLNNILTSEPKPPSQVISGMQSQKAQANRNAPMHSLPAVNEVMERIVLKALYKRKEMRYQNAGELGKDIARYLRGTIIPPPPPPPPEKKTRKPVIYAAMLAGLIVVLGIAGIIWHSLAANRTAAKTAITTGGESDSPTTQEATRIVSNESQLSGQQTVDLLRLVDPSKDAVAGTWIKDIVGLRCESGSDVRIEIPFSPPVEYDLRVNFMRTAGGGNGIASICSASNTQFTYWVNDRTGTINQVNGRSGPRSEFQGPINNITDNQWHSMTVKVRESSVETYFDDALVTRLDTDYSNVTMNPHYKLHDPNCLGIVCGNGAYTIRSIALVEVTGHGKPINSQAAPGPISRATSASDWQSLFNGRDLSGWQLSAPVRAGDIPQWVVQDGAIVGRGTSKGPNGRGGWESMLSEQLFGDFHLRFNVMIVEGGGGIQFIVPSKPGQPSGTVINDHLISTRIFIQGSDAGQRTGNIAVDGVVKQQAKPASITAGKYFSMDIIHAKDSISVLVNDALVASHSESLFNGQGYIFFNAAPDSTICLKDIQILSGTSTGKPAQSGSLIPTNPGKFTMESPSSGSDRIVRWTSFDQRTGSRSQWPSDLAGNSFGFRPALDLHSM